MDSQQNMDTLGYIYAALVAGGGLMGFVKAGSMMSLCAGGVFGGVLAFGASRVSRNPNDVMISLATSTVLGCLMGYRFMNSGKFMPAGMTALMSLGMIAKYGMVQYNNMLRS